MRSTQRKSIAKAGGLVRIRAMSPVKTFVRESILARGTPFGFRDTISPRFDKHVLVCRYVFDVMSRGILILIACTIMGQGCAKPTAAASGTWLEACSEGIEVASYAVPHCRVANRSTAGSGS